MIYLILMSFIFTAVIVGQLSWNDEWSDLQGMIPFTFSNDSTFLLSLYRSTAKNISPLRYLCRIGTVNWKVIFFLNLILQVDSEQSGLMGLQLLPWPKIMIFKILPLLKLNFRFSFVVSRIELEHHYFVLILIAYHLVLKGKVLRFIHYFIIFLLLANYLFFFV